MSAHGIAPARLFTAIALVLGLTFTMFSFTTVGPTTSGASALVTAAKGNLAADWARSRKGSPYAYGGVYHVAIYAGHGYIWHAPHSGTRVRRDHIWTRSVFFGRVK